MSIASSIAGVIAGDMGPLADAIGSAASGFASASIDGSAVVLVSILDGGGTLTTRFDRAIIVACEQKVGRSAAVAAISDGVRNHEKTLGVYVALPRTTTSGNPT